MFNEIYWNVWYVFNSKDEEAIKEIYENSSFPASFESELINRGIHFAYDYSMMNA